MPTRIRPSWDTYFLDIARAVSTRSHDNETQVGAVIVDVDHRILSTGYNGHPPGCPDDLPSSKPDKYPYMIHAELNAIASCRTDLRGSTLYCTLSPCRECAKAIITAGIKRVVYAEDYCDQFSLDLLRICNVQLEHSAPKIETQPLA